MCGCLFNYISLILLLRTFSYIYQCEYINPESVTDKHNVSLEITGKSKTDALEDLTTQKFLCSVLQLSLPLFNQSLFNIYFNKKS